jgi:hypothetical protein
MTTVSGSKLDEIRERFESITPPPWDWFGNTETDQVYLGTPDRGRLYIMTPTLRNEQYVYDEDEMESYTLEQARANVIGKWCPAHSDSDLDFPPPCLCDELREFMRGDMDPAEASRRFETWLQLEFGRSSDQFPNLIRGVQVHPDIRFRFDGSMRSYRESGPRYEVLGYRTKAQWEMDQGGAIGVKDALYREDFKGLHVPDADFIAHSAEDVDYLLKRLAAAEEHIESLQQLCMAEARGHQFQSTADARAVAATTLERWEQRQ